MLPPHNEQKLFFAHLVNGNPKMKQYLISIVNTLTGDGSLEITHSAEKVAEIIDSLTEEDKFFVNELEELVLIPEDGKRFYDNN